MKTDDDVLKNDIELYVKSREKKICSSHLPGSAAAHERMKIEIVCRFLLTTIPAIWRMWADEKSGKNSGVPLLPLYATRGLRCSTINEEEAGTVNGEFHIVAVAVEFQCENPCFICYG